MVILLVEENLTEAKLTQEALREVEAQYDPFHAQSGEAATPFRRNESGNENGPAPNLVLLDPNLPHKHGRELLSELKSDEPLRRVPALTVHPSDANSYVALP